MCPKTKSNCGEPEVHGPSTIRTQWGNGFVSESILRHRYGDVNNRYQDSSEAEGGARRGSLFDIEHMRAARCAVPDTLQESVSSRLLEETRRIYKEII